MSRPTQVYVVASPRPRVGKTLVARAVTDFHRVDGRLVTSFDLGSGDPMLTEHLPRTAVRAGIGDTRGQMALFDQLIVADERPKVVDLGEHAFEAFFRVMTDIDFMPEARRRSIEPIVLFIASPENQAVEAYAGLHRQFADLAIVPVFNEGVARSAGLREKYPYRGVFAMPIRIPSLSPSLRHIVDTRPFSFSIFRRGNGADVPPILEGELESWIKRVFLQFRELQLQLLLHRLRSSLAPTP